MEPPAAAVTPDQAEAGREEEARDPAPRPASFIYFPALPAELRLQIWEAALRDTAREMRVVNMFVKCYNTQQTQLPSRLALLNERELCNSDTVGCLLATCSESFGVALRYLTQHPPKNPFQRDLIDWSAPRWNNRWRGLIQMVRHLTARLHVDPSRDALFLNGLDLAPEILNGVPTGRYRILDHADVGAVASSSSSSSSASSHTDHPPTSLLPECMALRFISNWQPSKGPHSRKLAFPEHIFVNRFRTIIMPAHGLIDRRDGAALFDDPTYTFLDGPPVAPPLGQEVNDDDDTRETFIAIVGTPYRGRNLQMTDLEFMSDEEVQQVYREGMSSLVWAKPPPPEKGRRRGVASPLHRDVIAMLSIWERWTASARSAAVLTAISRRTAQGPVHPTQIQWPTVLRPRLRFARVKQEALARLTAKDMYYGD